MSSLEVTLRSRARLLTALFALAGCVPLSRSKTESPDSGRSGQALEGIPGAKDPPARVVIVGGGIAGLVTAYELQKHGIRSHLLEANDVFGGRVQTAYYGEGLHAELGMQEMWEGNPLLAIAKELDVELDPEPELPFSSAIIDGKLHPYTQASLKEFLLTFLSANEQKALERWMKNAKELRDQIEKSGLKAPRAKELQAMSFAAWLGSSRLPKKAAEWLRLTLECELATSADGFSALAGLLELETFFGEGRPNYHVKGGNTRLIEAIARAIKSPKTLSALVQGVTRSKGAGGRVQVKVDYMKDHRVETIEAERVVLAVPFVRLHQINIEPPLSEGRWRAIQGLALGQYTVVHLLMSKEADALWQVKGQSPLPVLSEGPLGVIYGVQRQTPASQPLEVFSLLIYGMRARMFHMVPRETKIHEIEEELDRLWPGVSKQVRAAHVYSYHPTALPVWPPGRSPIDEGAELLRQPELGTYLAGDYTLGSHSDAAARSGIDAAMKIAAELRPE